MVPLVPLAPLSPMDRHDRHLLHCRHWHHCPRWRNWCHCRKLIATVAIVVNGATGSIGAIGSPNDPLTLNGDCERSIAIEWIKWPHLNGANGRQWRSPLAPMDIAIGANGDCDRHWRHSSNRHWRQWSNGASIGDNGASVGAIYCRHWRQWRQMIHSPNLMTLLPNLLLLYPC